MARSLALVGRYAHSDGRHLVSLLLIEIVETGHTSNPSASDQDKGDLGSGSQLNDAESRKYLGVSWCGLQVQQIARHGQAWKLAV